MLIAQSFDCCTYWLLYIFVSCELVMHTTCLSCLYWYCEYCCFL